MLVACWFAVIKAGGIVVATMPLLRERELAEIIDKAGVGLAVTDGRLAADLEAAVAAKPAVQVLRFHDSSPEGLEARAARKSDQFTTLRTSATDPAIIAFTSGTTGRSKGTVHTHRDILSVTDTYGRHVLKPDQDDIFIGSPPIAFTYGLGGLVLFPMRVGASTALVEQPTPVNILQAIAAFGATIAISSPTVTAQC